MVDPAREVAGARPVGLDNLSGSSSTRASGWPRPASTSRSFMRARRTFHFPARASTLRSATTAPSRSRIRTRSSPRRRGSSVRAGFAFSHSSPFVAVCEGEDERVHPALTRDYFGLHEQDYGDVVTYELPYGEWIRLFRSNSFVVEDLIAAARAGRDVDLLGRRGARLGETLAVRVDLEGASRRVSTFACAAADLGVAQPAAPRDPVPAGDSARDRPAGLRRARRRSGRACSRQGAAGASG